MGAVRRNAGSKEEKKKVMFTVLSSIFSESTALENPSQKTSGLLRFKPESVGEKRKPSLCALLPLPWL